MQADSTRPEPIVQSVHRALERHVRPSDVVLDATCGNGHDTLCLARQVGDNGCVHAIDVQAEAIAQTGLRLQSAGFGARVALHRANHADLSSVLPASLRGRLRVGVFNLGYRPGSDRRVVTRSETTLAALQACCDWLGAEGALSVVAYPGHVAGAEEAARMGEWANDCVRRGWRATWTCPPDGRRPAPRWLWLVRR